MEKWVCASLHCTKLNPHHTSERALLDDERRSKDGTVAGTPRTSRGHHRGGWQKTTGRIYVHQQSSRAAPPEDGFFVGGCGCP